MEKITGILIYEDNPDLLQTLSVLIESTEDFNLLGAFSNANNAVEDVKKLKPSVIIMDIDMPGITGNEALKKIKAAYPETEIMMLTVFEDNKHIFDCLQSGASGYLLKRTPSLKIVEAIRDIKMGGAPMTPTVAKKVLQLLPRTSSEPSELANLAPREAQILTLLTRGFSYKMIAAELSISIDTVRTYIKRIYKKLHVNSMVEAVSKAFKERRV
ncbi:MAG TPA: response regulator transcription factor [Bacteroidia bacterium]|jgi:two-component system nitrate/nitrite response regulator NarL|nr:response regulator transcription factor [Bacteroidia bacterium]